MICRSCGGYAEQIFTLGKMPLSNALLDIPQQPYEIYPIDVMLCVNCQLGQLGETVLPEKMFMEYMYYSSIAGPTVESARLQAKRIVKDLKGKPEALIIEIGSNDGYLLQFYHMAGVSVLGVDP